MRRPLDPNAEFDGNSEYSWGPGLFPPGIADNEGQRRQQDDFGNNLVPQTNPIGDSRDNYARAVADRRTDSTDGNSQRDFETLGNPDRYGGQPPLVQARTERNATKPVRRRPWRLERKP
jgi:hypothetical protein